jgi:DNA-binding NtrC family response regulator
MKPDLYPSIPVLLVDDEEQTLLSSKIVLRASGISNVVSINDSREVLPTLGREQFSVLMIDLSMPHMTGEEILKRVREEYSTIPTIILTGANDLETAVNCMKDGAFDYMVKPVEKSRLVSAIHRAIQFRELTNENQLLKEHILSGELRNAESFDGILTVSATMQSIFHYIESIAPSMQPVLVTGETGVGKEKMARSIHKASGRSGAFVPINVAGLDDTVFSDTLFGHKKGAFTGAQDSRKGLVESAASGTLFLDEIGDLTMMSQVKLLRLLQEREYYPLGSDVAKRSEARIVVATNQDLPALIKSGQFRKDLYYRLQTHHIHIPPMRERKEDLPVLVDHFVRDACRSMNKRIPTISRELYTLLNVYHFPGNIRELESMVYDAVSKHEAKMLSLEVFKHRIFGEKGAHAVEILEPGEVEAPRVSFGEKLPSLKEVQELLLDEALKRANNNQSVAAQMLSVTQQALSKRLKNRHSHTED